MQNLKLYHYYRSTSSWRVRWALKHKEIPCEFIAIDLLSGESETPEHLARHPLGYVPVLEVADLFGTKTSILESMAMLEFIEESWHDKPLLPDNAIDRAQVRGLCEIINADTQPLQNLNPQHLYSDDPEKRKQWAKHWIDRGLTAFDTVSAKHSGTFSFGDSITLADLLVVPQCYNAIRYEYDFSHLKTISKIWNAIQSDPAFLASHPDRFAPPKK